MQIEITGLNQHGQGVGRIDGLVVFVDNAVPGDLIEINLVEKHRQYAVGQLTAVIRPSRDRRLPLCPVADTCGGCALQNMDYQAQLTWKRQQVCDVLERISQIPNAGQLVEPAIGMASPMYYRSKVQFPVSGTWQTPEIGFFARRSHSVVDHDTCMIQHPVSDVVRRVVRDYIWEYQVDPYQEATHQGLLRHVVVRIGQATGQVMVILVINGTQIPGSNELAASLKQAITALPIQNAAFSLTSLYLNINQARTNVILGPENRLLAGAPTIEEILLGLHFRISPHSFFQVNPLQTAVLYQAAITAAGLTSEDTVLDLYCGTGSISLALAHQAGQVIGIESVAAAIEDARINARTNNLANVRFEVAKAEAWLPAALRNGLETPTAAVAAMKPCWRRFARFPCARSSMFPAIRQPWPATSPAWLRFIAQYAFSLSTCFPGATRSNA
jgi:23S rRNA (uracil1939-C5)-methyltransferase